MVAEAVFPAPEAVFPVPEAVFPAPETARAWWLGKEVKNKFQAGAYQ